MDRKAVVSVIDTRCYEEDTFQDCYGIVMADMVEERKFELATC